MLEAHSIQNRMIGCLNAVLAQPQVVVCGALALVVKIEPQHNDAPDQNRHYDSRRHLKCAQRSRRP